MLQPRARSLGLLILAGSSCLATTVACGPDRAPALSGLSDQVAQVGTELTIDLAGSDPDGDRLSYGVHAADLADLAGRAIITQSPSGAGLFRWTPLAADLGRHAFDFTVSDDAHTTTLTINIDVRSAIGAASAPVFRQPLGSGTTIDLAHQMCIDLDIVVDDEDSATVQITQDEPVIEGAELRPGAQDEAEAEAEDRLSATWHWCPTREQMSEPRRTLVLAADDGDNPRTIKNYLVVLRDGAATSCPGTGPVIAHTPHDVSSIVDLTIEATISDDRGIKDAPLLYVSMTPPAMSPGPSGASVDLSRMTQLTMLPSSGDARTSVYAADVANPVAGMPAGTQQALYYVLAAADDDDPTGSCDHVTVSPVYTMTVTSTGTADLAMCAACTSSAQCGDGDECVRMGANGASFCLQACGAGCPAGTTCSSSSLTSIDGLVAPQCVPRSGTCEAEVPACADDGWEVNDSRSHASHNPALTPDLYGLVSCPSATSADRANDDWFRIELPGDTRVDLQLAGGAATDLDLHLYHANGTVVTASTSADPDEEVSACLPAGTYYVKVNGYGYPSARNEYLLSYETRAEACNTTCTDDAAESDDTYSQARPTSSPSFRSLGNAICPGNDDWYQVVLFTGDVMSVDLTFSQTHEAEDLDLHLYKDSLDLTPCAPPDPSTCSAAHGQGMVSNEHTTYTAPGGCELGCNYYVVVRGYNRAANHYGIAIEIQ
jgi:hypothetical protein